MDDIVKMVVIGLTLIFCVSCQSEPQYSGNPILPDFHADPSAHVFGDELWIFPSHDVAGEKNYWNMVDWHAFSTTDLVNYKDHGVIFSLDHTTWAKRYAWAPDATERNGKYYFYFCASDEESGKNGIANAVGVAVADKPGGPYKDALEKPLFKTEDVGVPAMDPSIFIDDDEQTYLIFGAGHGEDGRVVIVKMNEDMISMKEVPRKIDLKNVGEGVWIHKYKDTYYFSYPTWAKKDENGKKYQDLVYSTSKKIYGPYTFRGPILQTGGRNVHHSIVEYKGGWYLFYHVPGPSNFERRVCAEMLEYHEDGTIKPMVVSEKGIYLKQ